MQNKYAVCGRRLSVQMHRFYLAQILSVYVEMLGVICKTSRFIVRFLPMVTKYRNKQIPFITVFVTLQLLVCPYRGHVTL